jgi:hypothetical protein
MSEPLSYLCPQCDLPLTPDELEARVCAACDETFDVKSFVAVKVECYHCKKNIPALSVPKDPSVITMCDSCYESEIN